MASKDRQTLQVYYKRSLIEVVFALLVENRPEKVRQTESSSTHYWKDIHMIWVTKLKGYLNKT